MCIVRPRQHVTVLELIIASGVVCHSKVIHSAHTIRLACECVLTQRGSLHLCLHSLLSKRDFRHPASLSTRTRAAVARANAHRRPATQHLLLAHSASTLPFASLFCVTATQQHSRAGHKMGTSLSCSAANLIWVLQMPQSIAVSGIRARTCSACTAAACACHATHHTAAIYYALRPPPLAKTSQLHMTCVRLSFYKTLHNTVQGDPRSDLSHLKSACTASMAGLRSFFWPCWDPSRKTRA